MSVQVGDVVRLLDRTAYQRGIVLEVSTAPHRPKRPILVALTPGKSTYWFGPEELEVLLARMDSDS